MSRGRTYLDWNATAPLRPEAREAMLAALDLVGNPSSVHAEGRKARALIEDAREAIARRLRVRPGDVFFTSGATEGAAWVLTPNTARRGNRTAIAALLVGATEHACVLQGHRFPAERVETLGVDAEGTIDLARAGGPPCRLTGRHGEAGIMVAVQAANNETGVLQPTRDIAELTRAAGAVLVCDAVQLAGRAACDADAIGADVLILSSHKLGGPKGVGAVVLVGDRVQPEPLIRGGGQERRQRSGTENVAGIAGFAAAFEAAMAETDAFAAEAARLQQRLEAGLRAIRPDTVVFGEGARAPAQHQLLCRPRHVGRDGADRARPRRRRRQLGLGLLLGQGGAEPRARRHGCRCRARQRRDPRQHGTRHHRGRYRRIPVRLDEDQQPPRDAQGRVRRS